MTFILVTQNETERTSSHKNTNTSIATGDPNAVQDWRVSFISAEKRFRLIQTESKKRVK